MIPALPFTRPKVSMMGRLCDYVDPLKFVFDPLECVFLPSFTYSAAPS